MTPPNPSEAAREAALKIERMVINWIAGEKNNCGLAAIEAIIQAAIEAHEKPMREWIMQRAAHAKLCNTQMTTDSVSCDCGLSKLRSSLHHED